MVRRGHNKPVLRFWNHDGPGLKSIRNPAATIPGSHKEICVGRRPASLPEVVATKADDMIAETPQAGEIA